MKSSKSFQQSATFVSDGIRRTLSWPDALQIAKRHLWWRSLNQSERVVATVLVGAGSLVVRS